MDYAKIYDDFYSRYYNKTELLIKLYFIKCKNNNRPYVFAINNIKFRLDDKILKNLNLNKYDCLKNLHAIFLARYTLYETDLVQGVFAHEIKIAFDQIKTSETPTNYSYTQLIKDIALFNIINEILRLLTNNSALLKMCYRAKYFDEFEIRERKEFYLENYPLYKKLDLLLNPIHINLETEITKEKENEEKNEKHAINIAPSLFINGEVSTCFLHYVENYILIFFTDYSYLKRRLENENLIHNKTDNDFMLIIFKKLKLISDEKYDEYLMKEKLTSLTKCTTAYREANFNIVFKSVINIKN